MKQKKLILTFFLLLAWTVHGLSAVPSGSMFDKSLRDEANSLLTGWMDTFLSYQSTYSHPSLNGGVWCPACVRMHGRIGDAVLPLMYLAEKTGDDKYLQGAKRLMKWMENVHRPDGSWMNDVHVSDWNGTTVFAAIALYEALHYHGRLLDDATRAHWEQRLLEAGQFMMEHPFIYSRKREGMRNMNVNYSASATYALYAIGEYFHRPDFQAEAREIASDLKSYFTENDYFFYGEGPNIWTKTKNGCRPVDLLYNVEESLPNMACYAMMAHDDELLKLVERSMDTHLEFMLPDGAWDNSWGTRSFKWTYWGGRTSDGFMGGYYLLAARHPEYMEAIRRNVSLLKRATADGLLYGGMHYRNCGVPPCIHHTFGHAKALTAFLELPAPQVQPSDQLPRDAQYGVKEFRDVRTWLVSEGAWRATVTGYDAEYKVKGTHPMGGAVSMLWHAEAGPVFAATMNQNQLIEAPNMQSNARKYLTGGTPRMELEQDGKLYSNLDDLEADICCVSEKGACKFDVKAHLVDIRQQAPAFGAVSVELEYTFSEDGLTIRSMAEDSLSYLLLPVIVSPQEKIMRLSVSQLSIKRGKGALHVECLNGRMDVLPTDSDGRIFNPVPGFAYIPLRVRPDSGNKIQVRLSFY